MGPDEIGCLAPLGRRQTSVEAAMVLLRVRDRNQRILRRHECLPCSLRLMMAGVDADGQGSGYAAETGAISLGEPAQEGSGAAGAGHQRDTRMEDFPGRREGAAAGANQRCSPLHVGGGGARPSGLVLARTRNRAAVVDRRF